MKPILLAIFIALVGGCSYRTYNVFTLGWDVHPSIPIQVDKPVDVSPTVTVPIGGLK